MPEKSPTCRRFIDRVVIVTGGASGIGLATAKQFSSEGANVVVADLKLDRVEAAASQLEGALPVSCDVSSEENVVSCFQAALNQFQKVDVVVNCAGIMSFKPLEDLTIDDWLKVIRVDLLGAFLFTKHAFRNMKQGGAIVNVSSIHAIETTPGTAPYAASKAAMNSLTRSAALEGKPKNIRVNSVLPGAIDTPMLWENPNVKAGLEKIERADVGKPEDLANIICYLSSDDAAFIQGASILVDGGRLSKL